jgi:hypothetical protein
MAPILEFTVHHHSHQFGLRAVVREEVMALVMAHTTTVEQVVQVAAMDFGLVVTIQVDHPEMLEVIRHQREMLAVEQDTVRVLVEHQVAAAVLAVPVQQDHCHQYMLVVLEV